MSKSLHYMTSQYKNGATNWCTKLVFKGRSTSFPHWDFGSLKPLWGGYLISHQLLLSIKRLYVCISIGGQKNSNTHPKLVFKNPNQGSFFNFKCLERAVLLFLKIIYSNQVFSSKSNTQPILHETLGG